MISSKRLAKKLIRLDELGLDSKKISEFLSERADDPGFRDVLTRTLYYIEKFNTTLKEKGELLIESASHLDDDEVEEIKHKEHSDHVHLEERGELLGGVRVKHHDQLKDYSVRARINQLKHNLTS